MALIRRASLGLVAATGTLLLLGAPSDGFAAKVVVEPGEDTLHDAVEEAEPGSTLVLEPGVYVLTHTVLIEKDLTIRGATGHREDVHIVGALDFEFQEDLFEDPLDWGHLLFATDGAEKVSFRHFTIERAPEVDAIDEFTCEGIYHLNHTECFGDAIHADGVAQVEVEDVEASLNGGNGIWVDGAQTATFRKILGVNNGAFGIDVDSALVLSVRDSTFVANQVSGLEASGHALGSGLTRAQYTARVSIRDTVAKGNSEIGIEVERFRKATIERVTCESNREDGFDADRVGRVSLQDSAFINNLDDAIEIFPVGVVPEEQPADFPGSTFEDFDDLEFSGNVGQEINHAPTEN